MKTNSMNAHAVAAYARQKWPQAMQSPVAVLCAERPGPQSEIEIAAMEHAQHCLASCDGWDIETLGHNIESSFPELDADVIDSIAEAALSV